jgi:hypothetical protein
MRQITNVFNVYKIDELSEIAKEKAFQDWYNESDYPYHNDIQETMKEFAKIFPVDINNWEYGVCGNGYVDFDMTCSEEVAELKGIRLLSYIWNNYRGNIYNRKFYHTSGKWINGQYIDKSRHSKIQIDDCCPLTGVCTDYHILQPIFDFMNNIDKNMHLTFEGLMQECFDSWLKGAVEDIEGYFTIEVFEEESEANEWEYREDGTIYY